MDFEKLNSRKIIFLTLTVALLIIISSAFMVQDNQSNKSEKNLIESIEFQNRNGNVATTELYIVNLANNSEYSYSKTIPGPGMLCDTNNPKGSCETETELGYAEINSEVSSSDFRKQEESFSTIYYPNENLCASIKSSKDIEIVSC